MEDSNDVVGCETRAVLVSLLKENTIVLNKSLLPNISMAKEKAWKLIADTFSRKTRKVVSICQLKKLLNNMKSAIKKKTDINATGNKPIQLLAWETEFLKIIEANENPVFCKIPGAMCAGIDDSRPSLSSSNETSKGSDSDIENIEVGLDESRQDNPQETKKINIEKMGNKRPKLSAETNETAKLTTGQLQRLLLLEQIRLTRLKSKREEMMIKKMMSKEDDNSVFVFNNGGGDLNEFLIMNE